VDLEDQDISRAEAMTLDDFYIDALNEHNTKMEMVLFLFHSNSGPVLEGLFSIFQYMKLIL